MDNAIDRFKNVTDSATNPTEFETFLSAIPEDACYYLIPLKRNSKEPSVKGKIKTRIEEVSLSTKAAIERLKQGLNVGCYAGPQGFVFIDLDTNEQGNLILPEEKAKELIDLLDTFSVITRNGGYQLYGINSGFKNSLIYHQGERIGEIRADWQYVVCVGGYVPSDNSRGDGRYRILKKAPIQRISPDNLPKWLEIEKKKAKKNDRSEKIVITKRKPSGGWRNGEGTKLDVITTKDNKLNELLSGPFDCGYDSRSEADFAAAIKLCQHGFNEDDIAGILQYYRPYSKTEREDYLQHTVEKAIAYAVTNEAKKGTRNFRLTNRVEVKEMPNSIPEGVTCIIKPPRVGHRGGTHYSVGQLTKFGTGNYVTHRHQGVEHALSIFKKLNPEARAIWLEGKSREGMCPTGEQKCSKCKINQKISYGELKKATDKLLDEYKVLTKEVIKSISIEKSEELGIPYPLCPYLTLTMGEKENLVDYCFTVVHLIDRIRPRDLLVLDESQTVLRFYPSSVGLVEVVIDRTDWHAHSTLDTQYIPQLREIKKKIEKKKRKRKTDKAILEIINHIEEFNSLLDMENGKELVKNEGVLQSLLNNWASSVNLSDYETNVHSVLSQLNKYYQPNSEYDVLALFEAILFPYKQPLKWISSEHMCYTLYAIGDAKKPQLRFENVLLHDKVIVIGGIEAERFVKHLETEGKQITVYEISEFPSRKNFAAMPINASCGSKGKGEHDSTVKKSEWELKRQRRRNTEKVVKELQTLGIPLLMWTGSKRKQNQLWKRFKKLAYMLGEENVGEIRVLAETEAGGYTLALLGYANSRIARAVDTPFIDVSVLYDVNFVSPYWNAVSENVEEPQEIRDFAEFIQEEITAEEATNMALRITPTQADDLLVPKIIICPVDELWKIKWVKDRVIEGYNHINAKSIVSRVDNLVRRRVFRKKLNKETDSWKSIENELIQSMEVTGVRNTHVGGIKELEGIDLRRKQVENGSLLSSVSSDPPSGELEISEELFNVVKEIITHTLREKETRVSQERLLRLVRNKSPVKDNNIIWSIYKKLLSERIIRRKKSNKRWMVSLNSFEDSGVVKPHRTVIAEDLTLTSFEILLTFSIQQAVEMEVS